ncbi:hypothetical protein [Aeromonas salmonicida]|uniref:hypothetical protein n=1 Tax=Aeromonas salmonicida TaxID=645 RepID=UPI003D7661A8
MKRFTHDADLRGMVVLRSLGFQLVPFKLHRFRKQRRDTPVAPSCEIPPVAPKSVLEMRIDLFDHPSMIRTPSKV